MAVIKQNISLQQCIAELRSHRGTDYGKDTVIRAERDSSGKVVCAIARGAAPDSHIGRVSRNVLMLNIHKCVLYENGKQAANYKDNVFYFRTKITGLGEMKRFSFSEIGKGEYGSETKAWEALCSYLEKSIPAYV